MKSSGLICYNEDGDSMLEKKSYYINLYDCYSMLLTPSQREYFEAYFCDDLSLSEVSENLNVSRAGISKQLKHIKSLLDMYEEKIGLFKIYNVIDTIIEDGDNLSKKDILLKLEKIGG